MTQILMVLMITLAPAKADLKVVVNGDLSAYTTSCRLVVTRAAHIGTSDLFCTTNGYYQLEQAQVESDLVFRESGSGKDMFETIDLLESSRARIIATLSEKGFRTENAKCALPQLTDGALDHKSGYQQVSNDYNVRTRKIMAPSGSTRVCIFNR